MPVPMCTDALSSGQFYRGFSTAFLATLVPIGTAPHVWNCYAVVVGKDAFGDGSVLLAHNEQKGGKRILDFRRRPRE